MMSGKPAFSIHFDHEAETFDTPQQAGQPTATTHGHSTTLADWKGECSRRVPGEVSTGRSEATEERSEPRAHESARASEVLSARESTSGTEQSTASQPIFHQ